MTVATWADPSATWADPTSTWAYAGVTDLEPTFEWSPSTNPGATPVWEDLTDYVLSGRIDRGRQSEFDRTSAGRMSLLLDNRDRTFDPAYNNQARPNVRIRATVGSGGDLVSLYDGYIDGLPQAYDPPNDATVELTATDGFKMLSRFVLDEIYGSVVEDDSPWVWFRFTDDLPRVTQASDASGNGRHGLYKGTPTNGRSLIADGPGGSLQMDGGAVAGTDSDHVSADGVVLSNTLFSVPVTIEAWVRTGKFGANSSFICGQTHTVSSTAFVIDYGFVMDNSTGGASFTALVGNGTKTITGGVIRDDGPHHLVGTIDGSRVMRFYIDGVLQSGTGAPAGSGTSIDGSGTVRIGKPPIDFTGSGSAWGYRPYKGEVSEFAVYDSVLSAADVLEHYTAGAAPWANETTGARVTRVLNLAGWPAGDRSIETGASTLGVALNIEGRSALDHLLAVEQTEQGRFFIAGDGTASFYSRHHETSLTTQADFTDSDSSFIDLRFDFSDANLINDCTVTRVGGVPQRAQSASSIATHWRMSEQLSGLLYSTDNEAMGMAEWRVFNFGYPTMRPTGVRFVPMLNLPDLFERVISRELGDRISVTRSLEGVDIDVDAVIEGIQHVFDRRQWETSWNLSPLIYGQFGPGGGNNNYRYLRLANTVVGDADDNGAMLASNPPVDTDNRLGN